MRLMHGECPVMCGECNGYLWSESVADTGKDDVVIPCPYKRGGKCMPGAPRSDNGKAKGGK